jgi:CubicO group peptidase (beta-lactamase class C family)
VPLGMSCTSYGLTAPLMELPRVVPPPRLYRPTDLPQAASGVLSTVDDCAILLQTLLNGGTYGEYRLLSRASVTEMTQNQTEGIATADGQEASWGLGWMVRAKSRWAYYGGIVPRGSYYHTGASGVGFWVDPAHQIIGAYFSVLRGRDPATNDFVWDFDLFQDMVTAAAD